MTATVALLIVCALPLIYFYFLAAGSCLPPRKGVPAPSKPSHRFALVIAAHDEASVIAQTVHRLRALDYPSALFEIHVVADYCSDATADLAEAAGATAHRRDEGPRGGKGAALAWGFARILDRSDLDAVVVFDADTLVDSAFLRHMDRHLAQGANVIQGAHQIRNPEAGWFPALTQAKFLIDNRVHNLGRTRLGLSAKNMGDSICLRASVLRDLGWGEGLTEDYQLRQRLILAGHSIVFVPEAIGWGEAPPQWSQARVQRTRWMKGANEVAANFRGPLFQAGLKGNLAALDAAWESTLPTFSTAAAVTTLWTVGETIASLLGHGSALLPLWGALLAGFGAYPLVGLALAGAPRRAYAALLGGPVFVLWRLWTAVRLRLTRAEVAWVRTQHGARP